MHDLDLVARVRIQENEILRDMQRIMSDPRIKVGGKGLVGINARNFTQPLGRIRGELGEFQKSLEASNARVIAFGLSAGAIYSVTSALKFTVRAAIDVEKSLNEIAVVMGRSTKGMGQFGEQLFTIAGQMGTSFSEAAKAALDLSRQGLGVQDTLKRTSDALLLARMSGLSAEEAVSSITAAINSFNNEIIDSTRLVNQMAAVDMKFAVSSSDLAEAIRRVGSTASDAGVSIEQLIALITAAQQTTQRGGAVIGNALKSIFTRLERPKVLEQLAAVGVEFRNVDGSAKPMLSTLTELANKYDDLTSAQQSHVSELVGGVYQMNILKAVLRDVGKNFSFYTQALDTAISATNEAQLRSEELNQTLSAKLNKTLQNFNKVGAGFGSLIFGPSIDKVLNSVNTLMETDLGQTFSKSFATGIGKMLSGPGISAITLMIIQLSKRLGGFLQDALLQVSGVQSQRKKTELIEQEIFSWMIKQKDILNQLSQGSANLNKIQEQFISSLQKEVNLLHTIRGISKQVSAVAIAGGYKQELKPTIGTKSQGHIPEAAERIGALAGGYKPGNVKQMMLEGKNVLYNTAEQVVPLRKVVPWANKNSSFIIPPKGSKARDNYDRKLKDKGISPEIFNSRGHIPNLGIKTGPQVKTNVNATAADLARDVEERYLVAESTATSLKSYQGKEFGVHGLTPEKEALLRKIVNRGMVAMVHTAARKVFGAKSLSFKFNPNEDPVGLAPVVGSVFQGGINTALETGISKGSRDVIRGLNLKNEETVLRSFSKTELLPKGILSKKGAEHKTSEERVNAAIRERQFAKAEIDAFYTKLGVQYTGKKGLSNEAKMAAKEFYDNPEKRAEISKMSARDIKAMLGQAAFRIKTGGSALSSGFVPNLATILGKGMFGKFVDYGKSYKGIRIGQKEFGENADRQDIINEFRVARQLERTNLPEFFKAPKTIGSLQGALNTNKITKEIFQGQTIFDIGTNAVVNGKRLSLAGSRKLATTVAPFANFASDILHSQGVRTGDFETNPDNIMLNETAQKIFTSIAFDRKKSGNLWKQLSKGSNLERVTAALGRKGARMGIVDPGRFELMSQLFPPPMIAGGYIPNLGLIPSGSSLKTNRVPTAPFDRLHRVIKREKVLQDKIGNSLVAKSLVPSSSILPSHSRSFELGTPSGSSLSFHKNKADKSLILDLIISKQKGEGTQLFSQLVKYAKKRKYNIFSSELVQQKTKDDSIFATFPQLKIRQKLGLEDTSAKLTYSAEDSEYVHGLSYIIKKLSKLSAVDLEHTDVSRIISRPHNRGYIPNLGILDTIKLMARGASQFSQVFDPKTLGSVATGKASPESLLPGIMNFISRPSAFIKSNQDIDTVSGIMNLLSKNEKIREMLAMQLAKRVPTVDFRHDNLKSAFLGGTPKASPLEDFSKYKLFGGGMGPVDFTTKFRGIGAAFKLQHEIKQLPNNTISFLPGTQEYDNTRRAISSALGFDTVDIEGEPYNTRDLGKGKYLAYSNLLGRFVGRYNKRKTKATYRDRWDINLHPEEERELQSFFNTGKKILPATLGSGSYEANEETLILRKVLSQYKYSNPVTYKGVIENLAKGHIPNLSPISDAVGREVSAGYSPSQVKLGYDQRVGPLVYNTTEGNAKQAVDLHLSSGKSLKQIRNLGKSKGHIPNLADDMAFSNIASGLGLFLMQWKQEKKGGYLEPKLQETKKNITTAENEIEKIKKVNRDLLKTKLEELKQERGLARKKAEQMGIGYEPNKAIKAHERPGSERITQIREELRGLLIGRGQQISAQKTKIGELEKTKEDIAAKQAAAQKRGSTALGATFMLPMIGGMAGNIAGNWSPKLGKAIGEISDAASMAALSIYAIPGPIGVAVGTFVASMGLASAGWKFISHKAPDLAKKLDEQKDALEKVGSSVNVFLQTFDKLSESYKNQNASAETIARLNQQYVSALAEVPPQYRLMLASAPNVEEAQKMMGEQLLKEANKVNQLGLAERLSSLIDKSSGAFWDTGVFSKTESGVKQMKMLAGTALSTADKPKEFIKRIAQTDITSFSDWTQMMKDAQEAGEIGKDITDAFIYFANRASDIPGIMDTASDSFRGFINEIKESAKTMNQISESEELLKNIRRDQSKFISKLKSDSENAGKSIESLNSSIMLIASQGLAFANTRGTLNAQGRTTSALNQISLAENSVRQLGEGISDSLKSRLENSFALSRVQVEGAGKFSQLNAEGVNNLFKTVNDALYNIRTQSLSEKVPGIVENPGRATASINALKSLGELRGSLEGKSPQEAFAALKTFAQQNNDVLGSLRGDIETKNNEIINVITTTGAQLDQDFKEQIRVAIENNKINDQVRRAAQASRTFGGSQGIFNASAYKEGMDKLIKGLAALTQKGGEFTQAGGAMSFLEGIKETVGIDLSGPGAANLKEMVVQARAKEIVSKGRSIASQMEASAFNAPRQTINYAGVMQSAQEVRQATAWPEAIGLARMQVNQRLPLNQLGGAGPWVEQLQSTMGNLSPDIQQAFKQGTASTLRVYNTNNETIDRDIKAKEKQISQFESYQKDLGNAMGLMNRGWGIASEESIANKGIAGEITGKLSSGDLVGALKTVIEKTTDPGRKSQAEKALGDVNKFGTQKLTNLMGKTETSSARSANILNTLLNISNSGSSHSVHDSELNKSMDKLVSSSAKGEIGGGKSRLLGSAAQVILGGGGLALGLASRPGRALVSSAVKKIPSLYKGLGSPLEELQKSFTWAKSGVGGALGNLGRGASKTAGSAWGFLNKDITPSINNVGQLIQMQLKEQLDSMRPFYTPTRTGVGTSISNILRPMGRGISTIGGGIRNVSKGIGRSGILQLPSQIYKGLGGMNVMGGMTSEQLQSSQMGINLQQTLSKTPKSYGLTIPYGPTVFGQAKSDIGKLAGFASKKVQSAYQYAKPRITGALTGVSTMGGMTGKQIQELQAGLFPVRQSGPIVQPQPKLTYIKAGGTTGKTIGIRSDLYTPRIEGGREIISAERQMARLKSGVLAQPGSLPARVGAKITNQRAEYGIKAASMSPGQIAKVVGRGGLGALSAFALNWAKEKGIDWLYRNNKEAQREGSSKWVEKQAVKGIGDIIANTAGGAIGGGIRGIVPGFMAGGTEATSRSINTRAVVSGQELEAMRKENLTKRYSGIASSLFAPEQQKKLSQYIGGSRKAGLIEEMEATRGQRAGFVGNLYINRGVPIQQKLWRMSVENRARKQIAGITPENLLEEQTKQYKSGITGNIQSAFNLANAPASTPGVTREDRAKGLERWSELNQPNRLAAIMEEYGLGQTGAADVTKKYGQYAPGVFDTRAMVSFKALSQKGMMKGLTKDENLMFEHLGKRFIGKEFGQKGQFEDMSDQDLNREISQLYKTPGEPGRLRDLETERRRRSELSLGWNKFNEKYTQQTRSLMGLGIPVGENAPGLARNIRNVGGFAEFTTDSVNSRRDMYDAAQRTVGFRGFPVYENNDLRSQRLRDMARNPQQLAAFLGEGNRGYGNAQNRQQAQFQYDELKRNGRGYGVAGNQGQAPDSQIVKGLEDAVKTNIPELSQKIGNSVAAALIESQKQMGKGQIEILLPRLDVNLNGQVTSNGEVLGPGNNLRSFIWEVISEYMGQPIPKRQEPGSNNPQQFVPISSWSTTK